VQQKLDELVTEASPGETHVISAGVSPSAQTMKCVAGVPAEETSAQMPAS
jgi:hypothetical protein